MERSVPTREEVERYLSERRNWGRWGKDDEVGAINLITAEKRVAAARLVQTGRTVSLSRLFPTVPAPNNPSPAIHYLRWSNRPGGGGGVTDFYGISYHGYSTTHIDALCHVWDQHGMYNGRDPQVELTTQGARFGSVDAWKDGILTRGVLLDVPRFRGEPYVTADKPVHGWELADVAEKQGVTLEPGDALLVYSGREKYVADHPEWTGFSPPSPGLHASCLPFIRDNDVAILGWDMMDATHDYGLPWTVHGALFSYGVALLDNSLLEPIADACAEEGRHTFMLSINPLRVRGGTGSPVNPIAVF